MDSSSRKKIVLLARKARRIVERIAKEEGFPHCLGGMCARASAILFGLLQDAGFRPYICFGFCHCYIEVEDLIVDITASQFGYSKVFIVHCDELYNKLNAKDQVAADEHRCWWSREPENAYDDIDGAIRHQELHDWPPEQMISRDELI